MRKGKHQIRMQWNCTDHLWTNPIRINLDNGDYTKNMKITSMEIMYMSTDRDTNNRDLSGQAHFVVIALTEAGAIPHSTETINNREYALRGVDRNQIGWGTLEQGFNKTILDPHNIVSGDLWLNAWTLSSAKAPAELEADVFLLITMEQVTQSGAEGLLSAVRDEYVDD